MKLVRLLGVLLLVLALALGAALWTTRPDPLPPGSESAARLEPGPYGVRVSERVWIDATRPTAANGDFEGAPERTFEVTIWSPEAAPGPHPLVVYSHGFMSTRDGGTHLARHLASHGYVVVAASYPLTHYFAPGGPNANDVVHQPADVSFLIDRTLALGPEERAFAGGIARDRIAVVGLSLGGLTSTLVAFHPRLGDPRIEAAVSIAGPSVMFGPRYFASRDVPFLMIAGTHDSMIHFDENATPIPDKISKGGLVAIDGASHAGFSYMASGLLRLLGNPDELGCSQLTRNLDFEAGRNPFPQLGGSDEGLLDAVDATLPCEVRFDEAMSAGRQQALTILAVHAFLESHFADDPSEKASQARFLERTLTEELPEVRYTPARRAS